MGLRKGAGDVENDSSLEGVAVNPMLTAVDIVVEYRELLLYRDPDESEVISGDDFKMSEWLPSAVGLLEGELVNRMEDRPRGGTLIVKSLRPYIRDPKLDGGTVARC